MADPVAAPPPPAPPAGGGPTDTQGAMASMKATFAEAIAQNAEITKIQTQGNTGKRAASAAPN